MRAGLAHIQYVAEIGANCPDRSFKGHHVYALHGCAKACGRIGAQDAPLPIGPPARSKRPRLPGHTVFDGGAIGPGRWLRRKLRRRVRPPGRHLGTGGLGFRSEGGAPYAERSCCRPTMVRKAPEWEQWTRTLTRALRKTAIVLGEAHCDDPTTHRLMHAHCQQLSRRQWDQHSRRPPGLARAGCGEVARPVLRGPGALQCAQATRQ